MGFVKIPNIKFQISNSKYQIPNIKKIPMTKILKSKQFVVPEGFGH